MAKPCQQSRSRVGQNRYICIEKAKIGCGSAMKVKQVSLCIALALHYLCIEYQQSNKARESWQKLK